MYPLPTTYSIHLWNGKMQESVISYPTWTSRYVQMPPYIYLFGEHCCGIYKLSQPPITAIIKIGMLHKFHKYLRSKLRKAKIKVFFNSLIMSGWATTKCTYVWILRIKIHIFVGKLLSALVNYLCNNYILIYSGQY